jgi:sugar phosphate isomerase/epimerase
MSDPLDFGVQSYCFRHFKDNAEVAKMVRAIGVDKIEVCGVHADFSEPSAFAKEMETYRDAGVSVISIGVQTFKGDASERAWFECAAAIGAQHMSCHFTVDTFMTAIPKVRAWCREYGVRAAIHCHGGYNFNGNPETLKYLLNLGSPEIGLCIDTAWALQIGPRTGNPVRWVKDLFPGKTTMVHYKDFTFAPNGQWTDTVVGEGTLDLSGFVQALRKDGFDGAAVIEYEADVENPVPALTRCVERMREIQ